MERNNLYCNKRGLALLKVKGHVEVKKKNWQNGEKGIMETESRRAER